METKQPKILDLSYPEFKDFVDSLGEPQYRCDQILKWIYQKLAASYTEMTDIPQLLRDKLLSQTTLFTIAPVEEQITADKLTRKVLFLLDDENTIESTLMLYAKTDSSRERSTVCVSTQVGCALKCPFCATGQQGFVRNLSSGEIIEQILHFARLLSRTSGKEHDFARRPVTNIVFMGMGEPLANYENLWKAITMLNSEHGLGIGARQITLSTSGLVPEIRRLIAEEIHIELAISLHAANDTLRNKLVPINKKYPLSKLIPVCKEFLHKTGRRPTFEYALFQGVNDSAYDAKALGLLLGGMICSVNLISGNPTACGEFRPSTPRQALAFQKVLTASGILSTIRQSRGTEIEAGCGQLKSRWLKS